MFCKPDGFNPNYVLHLFAFSTPLAFKIFSFKFQPISDGLRRKMVGFLSGLGPGH